MGASVPSLAGVLWKRSTWMSLAVVGALMASVILLATASTLPSGLIQSVRQAAQIQFMHAMSTFASATFMNIGASKAKHAPAFFIAGSIIYALPIYARALISFEGTLVSSLTGGLLLGCGWMILLVAAQDVDSRATERRFLLHRLMSTVEGRLSKPDSPARNYPEMPLYISPMLDISNSA